MLLAYYSITGNTRVFINRLSTDLEQVDIINLSSNIKLTDEFVVFVPAYAEKHGDKLISQEIMDGLFEFMAANDNYSKCVGIIGSGNRNFADLYLITAKQLSDKYDIPIIYDYEMTGTTLDVLNVNTILSEMTEHNDENKEI